MESLTSRLTVNTVSPTSHNLTYLVDIWAGRKYRVNPKTAKHHLSELILQCLDSKLKWCILIYVRSRDAVLSDIQDYFSDAYCISKAPHLCNAHERNVSTLGIRLPYNL